MGLLTKYKAHSDKKLWAEARTLADVGELTACWLEGSVRYMPGYGAPGPDPETTDLIGVLAELNRSGFITYGSQPGDPLSPGYDGLLWEQRAAVEGFVGDDDTLARIAAAVSGLGIVVTRCSDRGKRRGVTVTRRDGQPWTTFGDRRSARDLQDSWTGYGICRKQALCELVEAYQVTVYDPEWGRNDLLWPVVLLALYGEARP